jgi:hypothetical protein
MYPTEEEKKKESQASFNRLMGYWKALQDLHLTDEQQIKQLRLYQKRQRELALSTPSESLARLSCTYRIQEAQNCINYIQKEQGGY